MTCHLPCHRPTFRKGIGPTGRRKTWMVRVDECPCGFLFIAQPEVTWEQYTWIRRYNRNVEQS